MRSRTAANLELTTGVLCAVLLSTSVAACVGMLGEPEGGGGGFASHSTDAGGNGSTATDSGGFGAAPLGGGGNGAASSGGSAAGSSTGGAGGSGGDPVPGGGSGGAPPVLCVASGPKDCSPTPDPSCPDGAVGPENFKNQAGEAVKYVRDLPANASHFDYTGQSACCPKVGTGGEADKVWFRAAVLERLNTYHDLCAVADDGNYPHEISIKLNNACAEGYIVLTSAGVVRSPPKHSYNCVPANL